MSWFVIACYCLHSTKYNTRLYGIDIDPALALFLHNIYSITCIDIESDLGLFLYNIDSITCIEQI